MTNISRIIAALFCVAALFFSKLNAQTTASSGADVPRILSYQGQVTTNDGIAMNGTHRITATLYSDRNGKTSVWQGSYDAAVTNGNFNILLGSGKSPLPEVSAMNRSLWVGIKVDGGDEMQPLMQLSAAPYALNVPDQSITFAKLAPELALGIGTGHTPTPQYVADGASGDLAGTDDFAGGGTLNDARGPHRATTGDNNAIAGGEGNKMDSSADHAFIGGGGANHAGGGTNNTLISFCTVAGGDSNKSNCNFSFIGGGELNQIQDEADFATIGGGLLNQISEQEPQGTQAFHGVIAGGKQNKITGGNLAAICGGLQNFINNGGVINITDPNPSFIGGGSSDSIKSTFGTIGGGERNLIDSTADHSFIGGGRHNIIRSFYDVIAGGDSNLIDVGFFPSRYNFIGGGLQNTIEAECDWNVIGGGFFNINGGSLSFIGGGDSNRIFDDCLFGTIGGGRNNYIGNQSRQRAGQAENLSFIGGGDTNNVYSKWDVIAGGHLNQIASSSDFSAIGGGDTNTIQTDHSTIAGGRHNLIQTNGTFATITGGLHLTAQSYGQTVAGVFNNIRGSSTQSNFLDLSTGATTNHGNDPLFIVGNGTAANSRTNAFEVSNGGHSTVFENNGTGGATGAPPTPRPGIKGATYSDNVLDAWGHEQWKASIPTQTTIADHAITSITRLAAGDYKITLNLTDATGSTYIPQLLCVTVTLCDDGDEQQVSYIMGLYNPNNCAAPVVRLPAIPDGTFEVIINGSNCYLFDHSFMFHVTGR